MSRTVLTKQVGIGKYPVLPVTAASADITWTAADTGNNNEFVATGREILLVKNTDSAPHTVTIHSVPDSLGRTGDITAYSVGAGLISLFGPFPLAGWDQTDGAVWIDGSDTHIQFAVIQLPAVS